MLRWHELPVALRPDDLGYVFSGSVVADEDDASGFFDGGSGLVAIYTSAGGADHPEQTQSVAYSRDLGRTWTVFEGNPVIPNPGLKDFRDPRVFRHEPTNRWVMILAAGDLVLFYGSANLRDWSRLGEFGAGDGAHGGVWECPDLFELSLGETGETRWVLKVDVLSGAVGGGSGGQYFVGRFDGERFVNDNLPEETLWLDRGRDFYAAQSWNDAPDGRRIWLAWMSNWRYAREIPTSPWRGSMSLPREVTLVDTADGPRLAQRPVRELESLRRRGHRRENVTVPEEGSVVLYLPGTDGAALEVIVSFDPLDAAEFGLVLRHADEQRTVIGYDTVAGELFVDRRESGTSDFSGDFPGVHRATVQARNGSVEVHVFVDRSSVEVFSDRGMTVITDQILPARSDVKIEAYAKGGRAVLASLEVYEMESIWRSAERGNDE